MTSPPCFIMGFALNFDLNTPLIFNSNENLGDTDSIPNNNSNKLVVGVNLYCKIKFRERLKLNL